MFNLLKNYLFALGSGVLLTLMIQSNSLLAKYTTPIFASWIAHGVGSCVAFLLVLITALFTKNKYSKKSQFKKIPTWYYTGGIPGAFTVVLAAYAVNGDLSLSGTISLMLVGQVLFGIIVDHYGLIAVPIRRITLKDIIAVTFVLLGSVLIIFRGTIP